MCLAIPGKIISIDDNLDPIFRIAKVSFDGIVKEVNLALVPEAKVGDYVMVHVGSAISIVDEDEAQKTMEALRQLEELDELNYGENLSENNENAPGNENPDKFKPW